MNNKFFNKSKYTNWYYNIISTAMSRSNIDSTIYTENHHILPRSMGGSNGSDNLVTLTAREHFICHILLTKMCIASTHKTKMIYAAFMMCHIEGRGQCRYRKISSHLYETLKIKFAACSSTRSKQYWNNLSEEEYTEVCKLRKEIANRPEVIAAKTHKGEANGMYGKTHTDKVKRKLAKEAGKRFKGKSYEDLYGKENARKLKQKRSNDMKNHRKLNPTTGVNNPNAKRVCVKGIIFETSSDAAIHFNKSRPTISGWLRTFDDCYFL